MPSLRIDAGTLARRPLRCDGRLYGQDVAEEGCRVDCVRAAGHRGRRITKTPGAIEHRQLPYVGGGVMRYFLHSCLQDCVLSCRYSRDSASGTQTNLNGQSVYTPRPTHRVGAAQARITQSRRGTTKHRRKKKRPEQGSLRAQFSVRLYSKPHSQGQRPISSGRHQLAEVGRERAWMRATAFVCCRVQSCLLSFVLTGRKFA